MTQIRKEPIVCILLLIFSVVATLVAIELMLQTVIGRNRVHETYGKTVETNLDGFRDREYIIPKPDKTYRILMIGDSFVWGRDNQII